MDRTTHTAWFRFYEELNDFLAENRRKILFPYTFEGSPSVKDAVEAIGVPHTEVDLILVNGKSVDFGYLVRDGDRISVYPVFESMDITPVIRLRPEPLRDPSFILDVHLGKLARWLRLLGFDAVYRNDFTDEALIGQALVESRIILTQDRGILKRSCVTHGYFVRSCRADGQILEVLRRFDLARLIRPFTRCLPCNGEVLPVEKSSILDLLPRRTSKDFVDFYQCRACGKIYWRGSHYERMMKKIEDLKSSISGQTGMLRLYGMP